MNSAPLQTIAITGATGFVGRALIPFLEKNGFTVRALSRESKEKSNKVSWLRLDGTVDSEAFENCSAVIHLAGDNISTGRWTEAKKKKIKESRVEPTQKLAEALCQMKTPPKVFICASATGYYGECGDIFVDEHDAVGNNFLAGVCAAWEKAALYAQKGGVRVVNLRLGAVLATEGGLLKKVVPPFKLGLGGPLGDGKQYMSWIALQDLLEIILFVLENEELSGPVNAVSPYPVTNEEFTKTLGAILKRPAFFRLPSFMVRLIFGRTMADELILASCRACPSRLITAGFCFRHPDLKEAIQFCHSNN